MWELMITLYELYGFKCDAVYELQFLDDHKAGDGITPSNEDVHSIIASLGRKHPTNTSLRYQGATPQFY